MPQEPRPPEQKPAAQPLLKSSAAPEKTKASPELVPSLVLSSSPHVHNASNIESVMYTVVLALLPALTGAVFFFGWNVLRVVFLCVAGCLVFEALCLRMTGSAKIRRTLLDGSAILTGLLLAMNLPSASPWWLCVAGAFVAMVLGKHVFGGLGANVFNPAVVSRVFLLIAWPAQMTEWRIPRFVNPALRVAPDGLTAATPLGVLTEHVWKAPSPEAMQQALQDLGQQFPLSHLFLGNITGSLGETSVLLLLIGGIFLIIRKVIRWEIPVAFIGTMGLLSAIVWLVKGETAGDPLFHIFTGGLFLGAFFMATDYVTSPMSPRGMLVFGAGCGLIAFVIRFFGAFPEGVSFAILIMNAFVPLIDRYMVPRRTAPSARR